MRNLSLVLFLIFAVLLSSCASRKRKDQTISLSGAFALYPLAIKWSEEYKKTHPDIRFNISGGGAGKGMADALAGTVDLGMFSREISQEEKDKGVWWVGLTIDAVIPTIAATNPYLELVKTRGLTNEEFTGIFVSGSIKTWGQLLKTNDTREIVVLTRADACGAAETWAKYMGAKQENLLGIGIFGDPGLAEAVIQDAGSVGYNNTCFVYDIKTGNKRPGIEVIPIDINGNGSIDVEENFYDKFDLVLNSIAEGIYPSPPARELYFVSQGKPVKPQVLEFIKWTLTEGQKFVTEAGYVPLDQTQLEMYLEQLK